MAAMALAAPAALVAAYCVARILESALTQLRDGLFGKVTMHAVRRMAVKTFAHLHELSLRFHLERKIGGLSRVLERGREGVEIIVRLVSMQLLPTLIELALIAGYMMWQFDWRYVVTVLLTVAGYVVLTYGLTEYRLGIRRDVNSADTEANSRAVDSLINYEAVKYFGNEDREIERYDSMMRRYEDASVKAITSLSMTNSVNTMVFTGGSRRRDGDVRARGQGWQQDDRRFRADQRHDAAALSAALFRWPRLSRGQAGGDRYRGDGSVLAEDPEIEDRADAQALKAGSGVIRFDNVVFAYEPGARSSQRRQLRRTVRQIAGRGRAIRLRQIHHRKAAVPPVRRDFGRNTD